MSENERWVNLLFESLDLKYEGPFVRLSSRRLMMVLDNTTLVSEDGGKSWSEPRVIWEGSKPGVPHSEWQTIKTANGTIVLVWIDEFQQDWDEETGEPGPDDYGAIWSIRSIDDGKTWIDRHLIAEGMIGQKPTNLVQMQNGRIVVPVQFYERNPGRNLLCTYSSIDDAASWSTSNIIDVGGHGHHDGAMEPTLELGDGRLWMLIRTNLDRF